ncbi:AAA family ATPase [Acidaminobacter hydrogenoformans]|uniref:Predicted ATPase n=1 Tax=Acidaminobacter hydrogenoformans DSM 2784 TaxID=1120920 RepID=A0A1G5RZL8_9FIRM|nr:AAA family ATPase [Acidaminobacter hydrogenoformans]SCZ79585.1 Predicted ATPase [Acidaminobacter hydrogenoformans DSM 2784]
MVIEVKLMGVPMVLKDGQPVLFKYQKAEAVFYYIAFHRKVDRFQVMHLFWPEESEERARKNLRNALYSIRQSFESPIFLSVGQRLICFSEQTELKIDLEAATESDYLFMENFTIKDAPLFDEWIALTRDEFKDSVILKLQERLNSLSNVDPNIEIICKKLLKLDPYNEGIARKIMHYYMATDQYGRCVEVYTKLCDVLDAELGISPEPETAQTFRELVELRRKLPKSNKKENSFFFSRKNELDDMIKCFDDVQRHGRTGLVLISGEPGIGKSTLLKKFTVSIEAIVKTIYSVTLHEGDQRHAFKAWMPVVSEAYEKLEKSKNQLKPAYLDALSRVFPIGVKGNGGGVPYAIEKQSPMHLSSLAQALTHLLSIVRKEEPLLICFEDIQWIDEWSLALLNQLVSGQSPLANTLIVATSRNPEVSDHWSRYPDIQLSEHFIKIELTRFNEVETREFIESFLKRKQLDSNYQRLIYQESEGNPLFLVEFLNGIIAKGDYDSVPQKIRTLYKARYYALSQEHQKIADLISIFSDTISWDELKTLSGKDDLQLLELIEHLIKQNFVKEIPEKNGNVKYGFTHQKLREFVYENQSATKRKLLHKRVGEFYKDQLIQMPMDRNLYPKLVFHYERAGDNASLLKYRILNLFDELELTHELFPRIKEVSMVGLRQRDGVRDRAIDKEIEQIDSLMKSLPPHQMEDKLKLEYLNMISRYNIINGNVQRGYQLTREMISLAKECEEMDFVYKGYLQMIYHCINQCQVHQMEHLIEEALRLFKSNADKGELGVLIRLKGYLMIIKNRFKLGESLLISAAKIFGMEPYKEQYVLNLVATYYYLGESRRLQNDYSGAYEWYKMAEQICLEHGFNGHLALVRSGIGIAAYDTGQYEVSRSLLGLAIEYYDHFNFMWGQVSVFAYWSLQCFRDNNYKTCLEYLTKADQCAELVDRAYEKGLVLRIKAEMCGLNRSLPGTQEINDYLALETHNYCREAVQFFSLHESFTYEAKVLKDIQRVCGQCSHYSV